MVTCTIRVVMQVTNTIRGSLYTVILGSLYYHIQVVKRVTSIIDSHADYIGFIGYSRAVMEVKNTITVTVAIWEGGVIDDLSLILLQCLRYEIGL